MKIIDSYPPNIADIATQFPEAYRIGVIFSYAPVVYAPLGAKVTPAIKAHEAVHLKRQTEIGGPEEWWRRYLDDQQFRFDEELLGHQAEYRWFRQFRPNKCHDALNTIAQRLSSSLYGCMVTQEEAHRLIQEQG